MNLDTLFDLFKHAHQLCGHREFVVIGSLSILGLAEHFEIPDDMTLSNDVDCYTKDDPGRIFDLIAALGENSPYHLASGYYLDPVTPNLPSLPDGWRDRLINIERDGLRLWFLDPNDAALSKYARGEPRDRRWIQVGLRAGVVALPLVSARFSQVDFLDADEAERARSLIEEDRNWFELVKDERAGARKTGRGRIRRE